MHKRTKLTSKERDQIAVWLSTGMGIREIARKLGRHHSSILRERRRNRFGEYYVAIHAQSLAEKRKAGAGKRSPLKNPTVYAYVLDRLREGWSPEQIDGRLEKEHGKRIVSYETIYRFIYAEENRAKKLWELLPWKRKKRYRKYGRLVHRERIPNRVSIHLRPKSIEKRKTFGHWEGDTVIGRQVKGKVIHTEVERKTRYLQAKLLNSKQAQETVQAQKEIFLALPCYSVTTDNGLEFVKHQELRESGIQTFFADPYASWQRGTNEYHNGLLRRYLPKKTNFARLTQEDLDDILWEINNRPRKVLCFLTPQEAVQSELKLLGGAIGV